MIKASLRDFMHRVLENRAVSTEDVALLRRDILPNGLMCREEADTLIALERAAAPSRAFADYIVPEVVEFVVWSCRPTGYVEAGSAQWLTTTLGCGTGPTETAMRIAFAVVKEAERVDEALLAFVMRRAAGRAGANAYLAA